MVTHILNVVLSLFSFRINARVESVPAANGKGPHPAVPNTIAMDVLLPPKSAHDWPFLVCMASTDVKLHLDSDNACVDYLA